MESPGGLFSCMTSPFVFISRLLFSRCCRVQGCESSSSVLPFRATGDAGDEGVKNFGSREEKITGLCLRPPDLLALIVA